MSLFHCTGNHIPNGRIIVNGNNEAAARDALRAIIVRDCKDKITWLANRIRKTITNLELAEMPNPELVYRLNEIDMELSEMVNRHQVAIQGD